MKRLRYFRYHLLSVDGTWEGTTICAPTKVRADYVVRQNYPNRHAYYLQVAGIFKVTAAAAAAESFARRVTAIVAAPKPEYDGSYVENHCGECGEYDSECECE